MVGDPRSPRWLTHAEAVGQSPFDLATYWGDRGHWRALDREVATELHEAATMAALVDWLTRWIPIHVHAALLGGATVPDVAAALGVPPTEVREVWAPWAQGQVHLWQSSDPNRFGVPPEHAERVRAVLDTFDAAHGGDRS